MITNVSFYLCCFKSLSNFQSVIIGHCKVFCCGFVVRLLTGKHFFHSLLVVTFIENLYGEHTLPPRELPLKLFTKQGWRNLPWFMALVLLWLCRILHIVQNLAMYPVFDHSMTHWIPLAHHGCPKQIQVTNAAYKVAVRSAPSCHTGLCSFLTAPLLSQTSSSTANSTQISVQIEQGHLSTVYFPKSPQGSPPLRASPHLTLLPPEHAWPAITHTSSVK